MRKKTWIISIIVLVVVGLYLVINFWKGNVDYNHIQLTSNKIINDQTIINSIVIKRISPLGNPLETVILQPSNPKVMDGGWKDAFYTCSENEHRGWIRNISGFKDTLYGPFEWCYQ